MAIVTTADVKAQLNQTQSVDDVLIGKKIDAAQNHIERLLGFAIEAEYPPPVPDALKEAVCQLAAYWYENREPVLIGVSAQMLPLGLDAIVNEYRNWSWAD